jgi:transcriptional regulator with XRE-family HTH domain
MAKITNPLAGRQQGRKGRETNFGLVNRRLFGEYLADMRLKRGLTQKELGKALGMTDTAISATELGRNSLSPERYRQTADALGIGRKQFARNLLRYYDPWLFSMLYPEQMPESVVEKLPTRVHDFRLEDTDTDGDETHE